MLRITPCSSLHIANLTCLSFFAHDASLDMAVTPSAGRQPAKRTRQSSAHNGRVAENVQEEEHTSAQKRLKKPRNRDLALATDSAKAASAARDSRTESGGGECAGHGDDTGAVSGTLAKNTSPSSAPTQPSSPFPLNRTGEQVENSTFDMHGKQKAGVIDVRDACPNRPDARGGVADDAMENVDRKAVVEEEALTEYERQRLANIRRNAGILAGTHLRCGHRKAFDLNAC